MSSSTHCCGSELQDLGIKLEPCYKTPGQAIVPRECIYNTALSVSMATFRNRSTDNRGDFYSIRLLLFQFLVLLFIFVLTKVFELTPKTTNIWHKTGRKKNRLRGRINEHQSTEDILFTFIKVFTFPSCPSDA